MSTPSAASSDSTPPEVELPQTFRIQRIAYFAVPMMFIVTVILAGASLVWLGWTLVLPVLLGWWIVRIRTVVTEDGLKAVHTFSTREIAWNELDGLQFPRWSSVRAVLVNGARVRLPAITFADLPRLSAASRGRIPDPYAAAAADQA
ncbi:PH domain-containing protein [Gordonia sp. SL306]|uniref:PH domain-containing protein n=1 Tax=Gordonia sp. SL306 TaxID=2995145 RepID=UPI0022721503|nr:PH domain-containing protein [Gordonia sp. SL306]WAC56053.1 PH domain-containing protein [Gordonia sp. SL306]